METARSAESRPETSPAETQHAASAAEAAPAWLAVARGVALFFGCFTLANLFGELYRPGFDANLWWIDLRPCPQPVVRGVLALAGMVFLATAFRVIPNSAFRIVGQTVLALLTAVALWNTVSWYRLLQGGVIHSSFPIPFSLQVLLGLMLIQIGLAHARPGETVPRSHAALMAATFGVCLIAVPLAQIFCFGKTDYRRPADVVVVFGCGVAPDGTPSDALRNRVATGVQLMQDTLAGRLILSGGPAAGPVDETDAMRELAIEAGIPEEQIVIDPEGYDTQATVRNTAAWLKRHELRHVLAVSDFYHLPRIKLCFRRQRVEASTVPAGGAPPRELKFLIGREVLALWLYYFLPLLD
jgi:uncharacterized SAM-binding protein YcdF (DUF218 family)